MKIGYGNVYCVYLDYCEFRCYLIDYNMFYLIILFIKIIFLL